MDMWGDVSDLDREQERSSSVPPALEGGECGLPPWRQGPGLLGALRRAAGPSALLTRHA